MAQYRVPVLHKFSWQDPILDIVAGDGLTPNKGDRYIVGAVPAGAFASATTGDIAWYDGAAWNFDTPALGWRAYNVADGVYYTYKATGWSSKLEIDGLVLTGDVDSSSQATSWKMVEDTEDALRFYSETYGDYITITSTNGAELLDVTVDTQITGEVTLDGTLSAVSATDVTVIDNNATALRIGSYDVPGILTVDTTNDAERVQIGKDLVVEGDLIINGETTTVSTANLTVEDKLITLNKGGVASSSNGAGFEFEENGAITGYVKVTADRNGYTLKAPGSTYTMDFAATANSVMSLGGNLTTTGDTILDQDVSTSGTPSFVGLTLSGGDFILGSDGQWVLNDNSATALQIGSADKLDLIAVDTTDGSEKVTINGAFEIIQVDFTDGGNIVGGADEMTFTSGTSSIALTEMMEAYERRAQYDGDLGVIFFDGL